MYVSTLKGKDRLQFSEAFFRSNTTLKGTWRSEHTWTGENSEPSKLYAIDIM